MSGDRQCGFASYGSTTDHVYTVFVTCLRKVGVQWGRISTVYRKADDSVWSELMFVIVTTLSSVCLLLVAARSKAWVCGLSLAGIAGSNPGMFFSCECCVLSGRGIFDGPIAYTEES